MIPLHIKGSSLRPNNEAVCTAPRVLLTFTVQFKLISNKPLDLVHPFHMSGHLPKSVLRGRPIRLTLLVCCVNLMVVSCVMCRSLLISINDCRIHSVSWIW